MKPGKSAVVVKIMGKEFQVACKPAEREALINAADELDSRMRTIRDAGAIIGLERIAIMVAINLCHELNEIRPDNETSSSDALIERLTHKIEAALASERSRA